MNNKKTYTKCWDCKNISKCEWSMGIPVPGWNAIPTVIGNGKKKTNSFIVVECPKFEDLNVKTRTEVLQELASSLGISLRTLYRKLNKIK